MGTACPSSLNAYRPSLQQGSDGISRRNNSSRCTPGLGQDLRINQRALRDPGPVLFAKHLYITTYNKMFAADKRNRRESFEAVPLPAVEDGCEK
ncbi:hypothetical protein TNCV_1877441 [Trichonephila clavipes]|nr:hypothetical protein TNCV_1877441 [Trichonephila clavipes]